MTQRSIKYLRTNSVREYCLSALNELCQTQGIQHQISAFCTLQKNQVAKRKNMSLPDVIRKMLQVAKLLTKF